MTYYQRVKRLERWMDLISLLIPLLFGWTSSMIVVECFSKWDELVFLTLLFANFVFIAYLTFSVARAAAVTKEQILIYRNIPALRQMVKRLFQNTSFYQHFQGLKFFILGK